jgi:exopolyphosphatase / guanosine-5'-triphosphate,3'-diphosphate pyrophosphatase
MIIAIIDLGTNTFNLLIADINPDGTYKNLFKTKIPTRLGEGTINKNLISKEAFKRGIAALRTKKDMISKFRAIRTYAFATSAIRSCRNGKLFIKAAQEEAGINVQVISGIKEAELVYYGVRKALTIGPEPALIMDIGGGSNEYVIATDREILWKGSFDIGVARLLLKFNPSDPITEEQVKEIENYLDDTLKRLYEAMTEHKVTELIGAAGSFETFVALIANQLYDINSIKGKTEYEVNLADFDLIHNQLLNSTKTDRLSMKGMVQMRVDMIVIASIMVKHLLNKFDLKKMRYSAYALKEGILEQVVKGKI